MRADRTRRPGEGVFTLVLAAISLFLLWSAYGISGFEALSSPGALPMATAATMVVTALIIAAGTFRRPVTADETVRRNILPAPVIGMVVLVALYAVLLKPLGFLPTSFLFLLIAIRFLSRRSLAASAGLSLVSVALIYIVFRLIFTVLMPEGIVPEREIMAWIGGLFGGSN